MARSYWLQTTGLVACLLVAAAGCKKDENKPNPAAPPAAGGTTPVDQSTPQKAAKSLGNSLSNGDTAGVKALITTTSDDQAKNVEAAVPLAAAIKTVVAASQAEYGKSNAIADRFHEVGDMMDGWSSADFRVAGDTATITPKNHAPITATKKDGKWTIDGKSLAGDIPPAAMAAGISKACNEIAADINAKKYPKAEDALRAFDQKVMAGPMSGPTSGPSH